MLFVVQMTKIVQNLVAEFWRASFIPACEPCKLHLANQ